MRIEAPICIMKVRNTIGYPSQDLGTLCSAGEPYINKWAKYKPVIHNCFGNGPQYYPNDWYKGTDIDSSCGITYTIYDNLDLLTDAIDRGDIQFGYKPPYGGLDSPYRLEDFNNYDTSAAPPIGVSAIPDKAFISNGSVRFNLFASTDTTYSVSVDDVFSGFFSDVVYFGVAFRKDKRSAWKWKSVAFNNTSNVTELMYPISSGFTEGTYEVIQFLTHTNYNNNLPVTSTCFNCIAIPSINNMPYIQKIKIKKKSGLEDLNFTTIIECWFYAQAIGAGVDYSKAYCNISFQSTNGQTHRLKNVKVILAENMTGSPKHDDTDLGALTVPSTGTISAFSGYFFNSNRGTTGSLDQFPVIVVKGDYNGKFGDTFGYSTVIEVRNR